MTEGDPINLFESKIVAALDRFLEALQSGKPIPVTRVRRIETPDGPMHLREKRTLVVKEQP